MKAKGDHRHRELAAGTGLLLALGLLVCGAIYGWRFLPGLMGEWIGFMVGIMTTPFILEFSFLFLGLILVVGINSWRRNREGEDFVVLEQVKGDGPSGKLPDHASWAVLPKNAPAGEIPDLLAQAEGALAVGDFETAGECLAAMSAEEVHRRETLIVRLELARATGNHAVAAELESLLASSFGRYPHAGPGADS